MFTRKPSSPVFLGAYECYEVASHPQRLEHQRWRLAEILDRGMVSREMAEHLRSRLGDIDRRLAQIDGTAPPHGRFLTPARDEQGAVL